MDVQAFIEVEMLRQKVRELEVVKESLEREVRVLEAENRELRRSLENRET